MKQLRIGKEESFSFFFNPKSAIRNPQLFGFTFLELALVICVISILYAVTLQYFIRVLAMTERITVEQTILALRNTVEFQTYRHLLSDNMDALAELERSNPMTYLFSLPDMYIGELESANPKHIEEGAWYFDKSNKLLVYRVRYGRYFESPLKNPPLIRLYVKLQYIDSNGNSRFDKGSEHPSGLTLEAQEPYTFKVTPTLLETFIK